MKSLVPGIVAVSICLALPAAARAQGGAIAGVARDSSGAVLPGVTVEASSPALIAGSRSVVTDDAGQYKIIDLRPGIYTVTFTLAGFSTVKRDGIEITVNFTAPVNADMRVGALEETITVSSASPVVDVQGMIHQKVMTRDVLDAVPTGRNFQTIGVLIPGIVVSGGGTGATPNDVGGSAGEQQVQLAIHGSNSSDMVMQIDGMRFNNFCGSGSYAGISGNDSMFHEISFSTGAISADHGQGGVKINMVPREGGNSFQGSFFLNGANSAMQSNNYTEKLKQRGLLAPDTVEKIWDVNASFGGPIHRNKAWFYGAFRHWGLNKLVADMFYEQDPSRQAIDDSWNMSAALRLTWQASRRNKFTFYHDQQDRLTGHWFVGDGAIFGNVTPEASWRQETPYGHLTQAKWVSTVSNRLLLEAGFSLYRQEYTRWYQDNVRPTEYSRLETTTNTRTVAAPYESEHYSANRVYTGSLSYVTGSHAFKFGFTMSEGPRREVVRANNDTTLVFSRGIPVIAALSATPQDKRESLKADLGIYAQDQWTIRRFTVNAGLRFDYLNSQVEEQDVPAGRWVQARHFDKIENVPNWKDVSPRLGVSYDLFGNGKTAVKTSLSRYIVSQTVGLASQVNPQGATITGGAFAATDQRVWTDRNNDRIPQLDELGPTANLRFGLPVPSVVADKNLTDGWLKRGYNWEYNASVDHELFPRVSVGFGYYHRWFGNFTKNDNLLVGADDHVPFTIPDPISGGQITLWDLKPEKRGQVQRLFTAASDDRSQVFDGFDATFNARMENGLLVGGGVSTGRTNTTNCEAFDSPNQLRFCEVHQPFRTQFKLLGSYVLPLDLQVSGSFQSIPGPQVSANYTVTSVIAGRPLTSGSISINLVEPGTMFGERLNQVDLRVARNFRVSRTKLQAMADVYNVFNGSAVIFQSNTYGPNWRRPTATLQGRLVKVGAQMTF